MEKQMNKIDLVLEASLKLRIKSFQLRNEQAKLFHQANQFAIKSIQSEIKDNLDDKDKYHILSLEYQSKAKELVFECEKLMDKASNYRKVYERYMDALDEIENEK